MSVLVHEMPYRPNVAFENPSSVLAMDKGKKRFRFTFRTRKTVTMYISFPEDGGVRIRNGKEGAFAPSSLCDIVYEDIDEASFRMTGNGISVVFLSTSSKWAIEIYDRNGELKTAIRSGCGTWDPSEFRIGVNIDEEPALYRIFFPIEEGEEFYGFGERFNTLRQQRNQLLMWNVDALTSANGYSELSDDYCEKTQAYKNIPLVHSTRNYSMFFNTYLPINFDMGYSDPHKIRTEIYGTQLDMYVWTDTPAENLVKYHKLTGTPFVPPKWAFDYWLGGGWPLWNRPDSSHALENLMKVIDTYEQYGVKINQAYLETDPTEATLGGLRDRGIRTFMWTNSVLAPFGKSELLYRDHRVKKASDPKEVMNHLYIDFTNPTSKDIINDKFSKLWDLGVCGEMVDFADSLPQDSIFYNGKTGLEMHNEYAYWYGRRMNEAFYERLGDDFVLFQRSGCAGSQHYTASFGGDSYSSFLGLKRSVWEMLSAAASGISIWGSDIGGFMLRSWMVQEGPDFEELYIRWVQFGAFSPLMRDHSWHGKHHPWANGERGLENFKYYYNLRLQLLDKVYSSALESNKNGGTVVDSMAIAYGMSPTVDMQYMFCGDFLVRPIVELGERKVNVIFPEDGFFDFYNGKCYNAGETEVEAPLERIPLFVKSGSVIPYNYYSEGVVPTWDKNNYEEAVLLTVPNYERETTVYTDEMSMTFTSIPEKEGFRVISDKPCRRRIVIIVGTMDAKVSGNVAVHKTYSDEEHNRTIVVLSGDWTALEVK